MSSNLSNQPNHPACFDISPARLDSMTVSELADAMEEAIDMMTEEDYDPAVIDAYLDAIDRKTPVPDGLNAQASYADFTEKLQSLVAFAAPRQRPHRRVRRVLRSGLAAALIAACLFGTLVVAQASGINVFGALAKWTESTFGFGSLPSDERYYHPSGAAHTSAESVQINPDIPEEFKELQLALAERKIPLRVPKMPEGFEVEESELYFDPTTGNVEFIAAYVQDSNCIIFNLIQFSESSSVVYEKDDSEVEVYEYAGVTHYIFSNVTNVTAVWRTDGIECSITTQLTSINMKELIQSMYEE